MKRIFDLLISIILFSIFLIPMIVIAICIRLNSKGEALHWSRRIGQNNEIFYMPKFRTMLINTPQVATHLLQNSKTHMTSIGGFLRKSSLDELPQLWSVLIGDMSLVGPRPALFNQEDLVTLRTSRGIEKLKPGLTGWAQINGRDDLPIPIKVDFDHQYLLKNSLSFDLKILFLTAVKVLKKDGVQH